MVNYNVPQGWQCPVCKRVYSPTVPMCYYCGNKKSQCEYYHENDYGKPRCWGTKNREECDCGGNIKKCNV